MKNRYRMYIRDKHKGGKVFWIQENGTNNRESLGTKDKAQAKGLLDLKNQPHQFTDFHVQMARTHLLVSDLFLFRRRRMSADLNNDSPLVIAAGEEEPMRRSMVWLMAISVGVVVANIYYAQPLLADIAHSFGLAVTQAG